MTNLKISKLGILNWSFDPVNCVCIAEVSLDQKRAIV